MKSNFKNLFNILPKNLNTALNKLDNNTLDRAEEIRLYRGGRSILISGGKPVIISNPLDAATLIGVFNTLMKYSYYAYEEDISKGFVTLEGGFRVGICGRVVMDKGRVTMIKEISSLNIRCAKEVIGCSDKLMNLILPDNGSIKNVLIASPPGCGKTTLLRDVARNLSSKSYKVSICDERSEIAGMCGGKSLFHLGDRVDVLDGCPKALGMEMLIRSMSPQVIITDEIGMREDVAAVKMCLNCGVSIITSVHGESIAQLKKSAIREAIEGRSFDLIIFLSDKPSVGTIKEIYHA